MQIRIYNAINDFISLRKGHRSYNTKANKNKNLLIRTQ